MIKTNTRKLCKAVHILREREKRMNDYQDNAHLMDKEIRDLREGAPNSIYQMTEDGAKWVHGEYAKNIARQKKRERVMWTCLWVAIAVVIIMGLTGVL